MSVLREKIDLAVATIDPQDTIRALRTELVTVQAQLAGFRNTEKELRELIGEVKNLAEGGVL
jgi:hypothetical protein